MRATRFNRSEIMKNAWRTYKYVGKKKGQSFGEVLKSTWRLAKLHVLMAESAERAKAECEKEREFWKEKLSKKPVKADYNGYISHTALYGHEFVSGGYCGD